MKPTHIPYVLLGMVLLLVGCQAEERPQKAQEPALTDANSSLLTLRLHHHYHGRPIDSTLTLTDPQGTPFRITGLRYILSNLSVVRAQDSAEYRVPDAHTIANALANNGIHEWTVGRLPQGDYAGFNFFVGLDRYRNHRDPMKLPANHPLHDPDMHWSWNAEAGYKFLALKGEANIASPGAPARWVALEWDVAEDGRLAEVSALNRNAFRSRPGKPVVMDLDVDVAKLFANVDLRRDYLTHSTGSGADLANRVAHQFDLLFAPKTASTGLAETK